MVHHFGLRPLSDRHTMYQPVSSRSMSSLSLMFMISTFNILIFAATVLQPPSVTLQHDIQRDCIFSYFPTSCNSTASPNGLSLISSFLRLLHPFNTWIMALSVSSPAEAIDSTSRRSALLANVHEYLICKKT